MHRFGWRPTIDVDGFEHVDRALQSGRSVVVWVMPFCGGVIFKRAFWRQGIPLIHLSNEGHGAPSQTKLGLTVAGPLMRRAESLHLAERVVIPRDGSLRYLRVLKDQLNANKCISIVGEHRGRTNVRTPFLDGTAEFATGAPALAWSEGAALLTAYTTRQRFFHYKLTIETISPDARPDKRAFVETAVEQFAERLQRTVTSVDAPPNGKVGCTMAARPSVSRMFI